MLIEADEVVRVLFRLESGATCFLGTICNGEAVFPLRLLIVFLRESGIFSSLKGLKRDSVSFDRFASHSM